MGRKMTQKELQKKIIRLERQVREQNRLPRDLLEKERLKGVLEMAGAICHELNQPMQVVSAHCERSMSAVEKNDPVYEQLVRISENIEKMANIVGKLQTIASYETKDYIDGEKIIDIDKASAAACNF